MGISFSSIYFEGFKPEWLPAMHEKPTYPPELGFEVPRKERVSQMTQQEMEALKVPVSVRDYCAHLLRDYYMCRRDKSPFYGLCKHEIHKFRQCQYDDFILRVKEFERERRLRLRKIKAQQESLD